MTTKDSMEVFFNIKGRIVDSKVKKKLAYDRKGRGFEPCQYTIRMYRHCDVPFRPGLVQYIQL